MQKSKQGAKLDMEIRDLREKIQSLERKLRSRKVKLDIMVVKKDQNWNSLVKSLEKRLKEEAKSPTKEPLNAVEVICSHEDIERTRQSWAKTKRK